MLKIYIFKLLITVLTMAVSLPSIVCSDYKSATLSLVVFFLSRIVGALDNHSDIFPWIHLIKIVESLTGVIGAGICFYYIATISIYSKNELFISENNYSFVLVILTAIYIAIDLMLFGMDCYKNYSTERSVKQFVEGRRQT